MNKPFIVADDFGLYSSVNEGIVNLLNKGSIDGASLMANGDAFDDAIEKLKELKNQNVGIHFVLVEEKPLFLKEFPKNYKSFFLKYIFWLIKLEDIEKELRAQLKKIKNTGIKPLFINSHQHLHLLPSIVDIVIILAKENDIQYIRTSKEPFSLKAGFTRGLSSIFLSFLSSLAQNKIKKAGLNTNDTFIGFLNAGNLQKEDIKEANTLTEEYRDKIIELGCHPGFEDENLRQKYNSWGEYNWQNETKVLKIISRFIK